MNRRPKPQVTENIIQESGLVDIDKNQVAGDIVYLEEKGLIKGSPVIGHKYSPNVRITVYGIDFIEKVFDKFARNFENGNIDDESKSKVKELLKEGESTSTTKNCRPGAKIHQTSGFLFPIKIKLRYIIGSHGDIKIIIY